MEGALSQESVKASARTRDSGQGKELQYAINPSSRPSSFVFFWLGGGVRV